MSQDYYGQNIGPGLYKSMDTNVLYQVFEEQGTLMMRSSVDKTLRPFGSITIRLERIDPKDAIQNLETQIDWIRTSFPEKPRPEERKKTPAAINSPMALVRIRPG